jgi:hypothetical protein
VRGVMTSARSFFLASALALAAAVVAPDAHACLMLPEHAAEPVLHGDGPIDGPIAFFIGDGPSRAFDVEVTNEDGAPVGVVHEASPNPNVRWIRPLTGSFPEGRLAVVVRVGEKTVLDGGVRISGRLAEYRLRIDGPELEAEIAPDDASPKIRCGREGEEDSCGALGDASIASRWRRAPVMSFRDHDPGWVKTLFASTHRWSVRRADGTIGVEETTVEGQHAFREVGVEYCVEATRTPLPGVPGTAQTERLCMQDDGAAFAWTEAENEAQLNARSNDLGCKTLDFPDGTDVPAELEDEANAAEGGCSVGARSARDGSTYGALVFVGALVVASRRRSRSG